MFHKRIALSSPPLMATFPSGLNTTAFISSTCPCSTSKHFPVSRSQIRTVSSCPALAQIFPVWSSETPLTNPECPESTRSHSSVEVLNTCTNPSSVPDTTLAPLGSIATELTSSARVQLLMHCPLARSQSRTVWSRDPLTINLPTSSTATANTQSSCPFRVAFFSPVCMSHTIRWLSSLPEITSIALESNATARTQSSCPSKIFVHWPESRLHTRIAQSRALLTKNFPAGSMANASTVALWPTRDISGSPVSMFQTSRPPLVPPHAAMLPAMHKALIQKWLSKTLDAADGEKPSDLDAGINHAPTTFDSRSRRIGWLQPSLAHSCEAS
mmetsp:Transcript_21548/g.68740  ORF Transcript_21548/g.68740 Transcript_21548/m.68740 type:complete len:328 (-) Transcript_21548:11-994(-)